MIALLSGGLRCYPEDCMIAARILSRGFNEFVDGSFMCGEDCGDC
jgi:hypothetical protein